MPIQTPQWTEFLSCAICRHEFDGNNRPPISLGCGHTLCKACLSKLHRRQCPFDQASVSVEAEELPVNTALLQLVGIVLDEKELRLSEKLNFSAADLERYRSCRKHVEELALFLKNANGCHLLSRPMQRKLVTLVTCQLAETEGKGRAVRAARSLGERSVTELILQHQNPQQLSANLWAAVRARGCQFLGPAMQEEVLRLVLLALEDDSALSRKVLVMFVVQRLEPHFPQASKTSIGHVVQLLYRASCFKVSKREGDSSLMQLKEEFRTYEALRREHDAQIVQIATEAGLRIAPDQWSSLLYGDSSHKSHMQSIIDKLQTPQSFGQSVQELVIALQRTGDPHNLSSLRSSLELLAAVDPSPDAAAPQLSECDAALEAARVVVRGLVDFIAAHGGARGSGRQAEPTHGVKYKTSLCRDLLRGGCPRGANCTFAHSEEELDKYRFRNRKNSGKCVKAESLGSQESLDMALVAAEQETGFFYPPGAVLPPPRAYASAYGSMRPYAPSVYAPPPSSALYGTPVYGAASLPQPEYAMPAPAPPLGDYRPMETARVNPAGCQNLLALQNRRQEILEQLEKVQSLHSIWNNAPLPGGVAATRAPHSASVFRLDDDDFVPFDMTLGNKYGPISPMTRSLQQRRANLPLHNPLVAASDWEAERMKLELESLKKKIDELRMATLESQHLAHELDLIEDNIREKERELRLTQRKRRNGSMLPMDEEDNGIANGMRELELRLQHDLEEPERRLVL